ncbi:uncharacterized protein CYBJADRAFT_170064 [Cyberlindnera jadinii NRRL Y-1542]|uniref:Fe2OG dioxygenase domain-containing protein n=1 Tax=Cyberlindnera jadinii (strain ATCC 18201 / CBS 1600 / BCRC 20928 / JCM 3617 / NBRC 0987 / NRRL Y-1542) TaxID=983966 RepID=A0A1E4RTR9_CYBJN|nr:hypothetical protein CYBJADRAFT_170064 [Cyberlindnera jadinii NRRL Y-1542]ODV70660.1 hypothetical protein CYBJADRAFT_170064 [Cyberlindnera jadinii NRRL Y-1542]
MGKTKPKTQSLKRLPSSLFYTEGDFSSVRELHPQVIVIDNFYSKRYAKELVTAFNSLPLETTPLKKSKNYAARVNDRLSVEDRDASTNLWNHLKRTLQLHRLDQFDGAKCLSSNIRVYRYTKGQYFDKHVDESQWTDGGRTHWTVLIYLTGPNEGLRGGETVFYDEDEVLSVEPRTGSVCLHRHGGGDCLEHEAMEVLEGEKWVLRSDIVF